MWTLQQLTWLAILRRLKRERQTAQPQNRDRYACYKNRKRHRRHRRRQRYDFTPIEQQHAEMVAATGSALKSKNCQNIKFITSGDTGYLSYMKTLLDTLRAKRPAGYVPKPPSNRYCASKMIECIVRTCYGSDYARILRYDVPCKDAFEHVYRECDIVRITGNGDSSGSSVVVGEIKAVSTRKRLRISSQLQSTCEVFASAFAHVTPLIITVKMASMETTQDMECPVVQMMDNNGFVYASISLSLKDALTFADKAHVSYDKKIMMAAYADARGLVKQKNWRKNKKRHSNEQLR
jgi:hypothetical protein